MSNNNSNHISNTSNYKNERFAKLSEKISQIQVKLKLTLIHFRTQKYRTLPK
jgi:hypothetical protein